MHLDLGIALAGLIVGVVVGLTGMGGGALMTPILVPIATSLGVDPVHFVVIMVLNLMIGVALPALGMSLFVTAHVAGIPVERLFRAILPFVWPMLITLLVVTYWPRLVLFVPSLLFP